MQEFAYSRSGGVEPAVQQVSADPRAEFLAGGTNLIDLMKLEIATPTSLVDINGLPLDQIELDDKGARIGAMVRNSQLAWHEAIRKRYPVLSAALLSGATAQLRNMATVGGNLLQRTRCSYFRDNFWFCNKREPGAGCAALEGYNRNHAVLGTSELCIATHPSDMCVALTALDAVILTRAARRERRIPIHEFYIPYGDDPARENVLEHGELILAVELPAAPCYAHSHYLKIRDRASFEFALVSAAAALEIVDGRIRAARLALGGVATLPWRAWEAERLLVGAEPNDRAFQAAARAALDGARPQKHNAFKIELARRTVVRALETVAALV